MGWDKEFVTEACVFVCNYVVREHPHGWRETTSDSQLPRHPHNIGRSPSCLAKLFPAHPATLPARLVRIGTLAEE